MDPIKPIAVTLHLLCRQDVPCDVLEWMGENLKEHAQSEFGVGYDPAWTGYDQSPLLYSRIRADVQIDAEAIANERVWRRAGAPPSSIVIPPDYPDPIAHLVCALWNALPPGDPRVAVWNTLPIEQQSWLSAQIPEEDAHAEVPAPAAATADQEVR